MRVPDSRWRVASGAFVVVLFWTAPAYAHYVPDPIVGVAIVGSAVGLAVASTWVAYRLRARRTSPDPSKRDARANAHSFAVYFFVGAIVFWLFVLGVVAPLLVLLQAPFFLGSRSIAPLDGASRSTTVSRHTALLLCGPTSRRRADAREETP